MSDGPVPPSAVDGQVGSAGESQDWSDLADVVEVVQGAARSSTRFARLDDAVENLGQVLTELTYVVTKLQRLVNQAAPANGESHPVNDPEGVAARELFQAFTALQSAAAHAQRASQALLPADRVES